MPDPVMSCVAGALHPCRNKQVLQGCVVEEDQAACALFTPRGASRDMPRSMNVLSCKLHTSSQTRNYTRPGTIVASAMFKQLKKKWLIQATGATSSKDARQPRRH